MSGVEFFEKDGRIYFECYERVYNMEGREAGRAFREYHAEGCVPRNVVVQGKEAIKRWTRAHVDNIIRNQKEKDKHFDELLRTINVSINTTHKGIILTGKIIFTNHNLAVRLDSPVVGLSPFCYGHSFGAAMAGHKVWADSEKELVFTREALNYARAELVRIFKNHLNASTITLVNELNSP